MSVTGSQQQTFLRLLAALRPHWRRDVRLPTRIHALLAGNRAFGSRDRRLYRELVYTTLRYLPWIEPLLDREPTRAVETVAWLSSDTPATQAFRAALSGGWPPCPPTIAERAAILSAQATSLLPGWFREHCPTAFAPAQMDALLTRASLWLRLQTANPDEVFSEFDAHGWTWRRSKVLPAAVALFPDADVTGSEAYRRGLIEVQDLGSQMILGSVGLEAGGRWLDACAGAGGKTLQLAALLGPSGRIDAHDPRAAALAELAARALRAGIRVAPVASRPSSTRRNAQPSRPPRSEPPVPTPGGHRSLLDFARIALVDRPAGSYDGVVVDAPCSGSGTWRRAPHLKWTTTPAQIETAARRQLDLLTTFSRLVRPGGRLVYATCSLSHHENEDVAAAFLATQPDFAPEPLATDFGLPPRAGSFKLLPARYDTDGFFVASLRRK
ncbi:MAG: RsmB/NOP family class I SAM-dependent RNA methyltransferase [Opitutaceae bacterium]|nr:RsmB/NOP family class I SAM-dependent RNA methyltransferase [Opitutaceae bacterium]